MLATLIIVFREVLEIALILGVLAAATRGIAGRKRWIIAGLVGGTAGSLLVARFAGAISDMAEGVGQEVFNAVILLSASLLIAWTVLWMSRHARQLTQHLKSVSQNIKEGKSPLYTLAIVTGLTVLREGSEIVLFLYGILASGESVISVASGAAAGLLAGGAVGGAIYLGLLRISPKRIFGPTSWLLVFVTAGLVSQALSFLVQADFLPAWGNSVWNTSQWLSESSFVGQALHVLLGYSANPCGMQVAGYSATLLLLGTLLIFESRTPKLSPSKINAAV